ncbi:hypothetical protein BDV32DRAFT_152469 [Aspergillus pseudonomiae]|nr:hypothetical protein BDV32DRAFT_152469 [Aspergillus pseudonomiae]
MSSPTLKLLKSDLFKSIPEHLTNDERIELSYHRAYAVAKAYGLEASDILNLTPKFWQIHQDMTLSLDSAAFILISLQYNIAGATFAMFVTDQPGYQPLLDRILKFDVFMQFMLTEVGHGLNARNLETTATLLPSGDFDMHTPNSNAAKLLPKRAGSKPLDHAITIFTHVRLPRSALLGPLKKPDNMQESFLSMTRRSTVGSLVVTTALIPQMKTAVFVAEISTELLLNRYQPPYPTNPTCLLAQHEKGLFDESRSILNGLQGGHHHAEFNSLILPRCPALIEAIGHRRAYEAAAKAGIDSDLLALYEIHAVLLDPSWYVQHTDITRESIFQKEARLPDTLLPRLDTLLDATGAGPYCTAPILSQASWDAFVDGLETLGTVNMTKDKARL